MRKPKVGDIIFVTEYYDEYGNCLVSTDDSPDLATIVRVYADHFYAKSSSYGVIYQILDDTVFDDPLEDDWYYALPEQNEEESYLDEEISAARAQSPVYVPQSYSDYNTSSGGGKTLKDYTGVSITEDSLGFKSSFDKAIEGITPTTLNFHNNGVPLPDEVNHPSHYTNGNIETIKMIEEITQGYSDGFVAHCVGTAVKYLSRSPFKHEDPTTDLHKAAKYLEFAIDHMVEIYPTDDANER